MAETHTEPTIRDSGVTFPQQGNLIIYLEEKKKEKKVPLFPVKTICRCGKKRM